MVRLLTRWFTILALTLGGSVMTQAAAVRQSTLVIVALPDKHIPTSDEIIAYFKSSWPDDPPLTADGSKDGTLFFRTPDDEIAFVSLMPARIPAADTEFACRSAYTWDEACSEFEKSNAHAIVSIIPQRVDQLETMIRTTKLAAAVSSLGNGLGVYWCEGETVEQPDMFEASAFVINRQFPPIYLWIGVKTNREKDGLISAFTRGLQQFDLMNVEIQREQLETKFARDFVTNTAEYLIKNGPIIKDGDTVGESNEQRIKVRYAPSILEPDKQVYRIDF